MCTDINERSIFKFAYIHINTVLRMCKLIILYHVMLASSVHVTGQEATCE